MSDFPKTDAAIIALSDALDVLVTANKALKDSIATADDVISGDVQAQVDKVTAAAAPPAA